jgi:hypothetical protein
MHATTYLPPFVYIVLTLSAMSVELLAVRAALEPMKYSIVSECLLSLRSFQLFPQHRFFRCTMRDVTLPVRI